VPSLQPSSEPSSEPSLSPNVPLGTAGDYVILAKAGISTVPNSVITGDIGVSPINSGSLTGFNEILDAESAKFSTSAQVSGILKASDYLAPTPYEMTTAINDMETAYNDLAGRTTTSAAYLNVGIGGEIGNKTLGPGVYTFGADIFISSTLTFSGTSEDVFIIQSSKNLIQRDNVDVVLTGGALAKNVFWSIAEEVIVGKKSHLVGLLFVKTGVTFQTESSLDGRIFSQTAVALQVATITEPPQ
jgi:hypothetical protein